MRISMSVPLLFFVACSAEKPLLPLVEEPIWTLELDNPCGLLDVRSADLNSDGEPDFVSLSRDCELFTTVSNPTETRVYLGRPGAAPVLAAATELNVNGVDALFVSLLVGDFDGDGRDDLHVTVIDTSTVHFAGDDPATIFDRTAGAPRAVQVDDIDHDGADELLAIDGGITAFDWDGEGETFVGRPWGDGDAFRFVGDIDGDGNRDAIVRAGEVPRLHYGCSPGSCPSGFRSDPVDLPVDWFGGLPVGVGDVDADDRGDLASVSPGRSLRLHLTGVDGRPSGDVAWRLVPDPVDGGFWSIVAAGDLDGDGRAGDVVVTTGIRTLLFRATAGGLEPAPSWQWDGGVRAIADLDDNRGVDLVLFRVDALVAFSGGNVPADAEPPPFPDDYACSMHAGDLPDLGVDRDLVARTLAVRYDEFSADSCQLAEQCVAAPGRRKLLDFSVAIQNFGGVAAEIPGPELAPELYDFDNCHGHAHVTDFANYELLDDAGELVVAGHKQGYLLIDVMPYCDVAPLAAPGELFDYLFISPGWADIYVAGIDCQWIDVTGVPDGDYKLRVAVNEAGLFEEDDRVANEITVSLQIAGDTVTVVEP